MWSVLHLAWLRQGLQARRRRRCVADTTLHKHVTDPRGATWKSIRAQSPPDLRKRLASHRAAAPIGVSACASSIPRLLGAGRCSRRQGQQERCVHTGVDDAGKSVYTSTREYKAKMRDRRCRSVSEAPRAQTRKHWQQWRRRRAGECGRQARKRAWQSKSWTGGSGNRGKASGSGTQRHAQLGWCNAMMATGEKGVSNARKMHTTWKARGRMYRRGARATHASRRAS